MNLITLNKINLELVSKDTIKLQKTKLQCILWHWGLHSSHMSSLITFDFARGHIGKLKKYNKFPFKYKCSIKQKERKQHHFRTYHSFSQIYIKHYKDTYGRFLYIHGTR